MRGTLICNDPLSPLIIGGMLLLGLSAFQIGHIPFLWQAMNVWDGRFHPWMEWYLFISMKPLMGSSSWSHMLGTQIHLFKALVLPTLTYDTECWGGDLKNFGWRILRRAWRCIWCPTSKCVLQLPIIFCWPNLENFHIIVCFSSSLWTFNNGLPTYPPLG